MLTATPWSHNRTFFFFFFFHTKSLRPGRLFTHRRASARTSPVSSAPRPPHGTAQTAGASRVAPSCSFLLSAAFRPASHVGAKTSAHVCTRRRTPAPAVQVRAARCPSNSQTAKRPLPSPGRDASARRAGPARAPAPRSGLPPTRISSWRDQVAMSYSSQWGKAPSEDGADGWGPHSGSPERLRPGRKAVCGGGQGALAHQATRSGPSWPPPKSPHGHQLRVPSRANDPAPHSRKKLYTTMSRP